MNRDEGIAPLLRLHAIAPHLTTGELLRAVSRVLTGGDTPPGGWRAGRSGWELGHDGFSAVVTGAWDGPELRLRWSAVPAMAPRTARLLSDIAAAAGDRTPAGDARSRPEPGEAHRAWQAVMSHWGIAEDAMAEVREPGRLHSARSDGTVVYVFDHIGPPEPPPGWLLRSWLAPDTGGFHCSVRHSAAGPRLHVEAAHPDLREQAAALLSAWRAHLPPRMC
ncbi:hypothetical protein FHS39_003253 [Streptomyces olivoverticillatus]|uniref:Uncharacterized protein n=1 Tax=Streptomyces olivoverticillatus TaxID=66427 RepID=A0A7W7LPT5_9ACTN|nr:hypothetical protein [Streptomyces olivoverticillatus]MBB4894219.1 hypothetical protein [Streptomyces olivoverticillatus]